jgi:energy-coupling factor transporter ATP-binding protein EcfA2
MSIVNLKVLADLSFKGIQNLDKIEDKVTIPVIGSTGAGKSSFISHMLGLNFSLDESSIIPKLIKNSNSCSIKSPQIGDDLNSCTLFPDLFQIPLKEKMYFMMDLAGFNDDRGVEEDLFSSIIANFSIKRSNKIKHLFYVIEEEGIFVEKSKNLKHMKEIIQDLIPENHLKNLTIIVTKGKRNSELLKKTFLSFYEKDKVFFGEMYLKMVQNSNIISYNPTSENDRNKIFEIIKNSSEFSPQDLGVVSKKALLNLFNNELMPVNLKINYRKTILSDLVSVCNKAGKMGNEVISELTELGVDSKTGEITNYSNINAESIKRLDSINTKLANFDIEFNQTLEKVLEYAEKEFPNHKNIYDKNIKPFHDEGIIMITKIFQSKFEEDSIFISFFNLVNWILH